MKRLDGWRKRLDQAIDEIRYVGFDWGAQHDCALGLAGRAVHALTGEDVIAPWRGAYQGRSGAIAAMRRGGFDNIADAVASILPEIPEGPCRARIGDIVAIPVDGPFGFALGVVNGERVLVLREEGIGTVDLLAATRAFRVG